MKQDFIYINTRNELLRIDINKIVFFEGDGNYTYIIQKNKQKVAVCMNLINTQELLINTLKEKATMFVRVGKRFIVNMNFIYQIQVPNQKLTLTDGETFAFQLGISKEALKQLKELMVRMINIKNQSQE